jgi:MFS family permease
MGRFRTLLGITLFWVPLSLVGDGFATLVLPVRIALEADPAWVATAIGAITFVGLIAGMLVQPVAGAISDAVYPRFGRRGPLIVGAALILAALVLFGLVGTLPGIAIAFLLLMVAANVAQAAQQGFIPDRVERGWRGRAAGAKGFADLGGAFLGFLLLGALLADGEIRAPLTAVAVVTIAALVGTLVLVDEPDRTGRDTQIPKVSLASVRSAYRIDVAGHPRFVRAVAARFLFLLGTYAIGRFFLLFIADRLGFDPATAGDEAGWMLAILALATALAAIPSGWIADRRGAVPVMVAGSVVSAAGAVLLVAAGSTPEIVAFGVLLSLGSAAFASANWKLTSDLVPRDEAARYFGIANVGTAGAAAVAGLLGPLADVGRSQWPGLGYGAVFIAGAVAFAASVALALPLRSAVGAAQPEAFAVARKGSNV